jgi:ABC-type transport system substrate-binding protein
VIVVLISSAGAIWISSPRPIQDAVVLKQYSSFSDAVQGLLHGEIDLLPISQFDAQGLKPVQDDTRFRLISIPSFGFTYIGMNLRKWPLSDLHFRQAMLYAFNRPSALKKVLSGYGENLNPGLFSSSYSTAGWTRYATDPYSYDNMTAKNILEENGFNVLPEEPYRNDPTDNQTLKTMFIFSRLSSPDDVATADLFAKEMQSIGIPVISLPLFDLDFNQALRTYIFDMFIDSSPSSPAPNWLYPMFDSQNDIAPTPRGTNLVGFDNSTFDDQVSVLMSRSDQSALQKAAENCQEILTNNLPVFPVFSKNIIVAASPRVAVEPMVGSLEETIRQTATTAVQNSSFALPLRIGFSYTFQSLDPATSSNPADWVALSLVTEPLATLDQEGKLQPDLATWNQTYRTLTLHIRQDAKYYTGQTITASDVAATLNWIGRNIASPSPLYSLVDEISRVDLVDRSTLTIALSSADNFAVYGLTNLFALPANRLVDNPITPDFLESQLLVSSGPFVLHEFTQTQSVHLQLNGEYFNQPTQNIGTINVYQANGIIPGSHVSVSPPQRLTVNGQSIDNASYSVCIYDQGGAVSRCIAGVNMGQGSYSADWQIDSRFQFGTYLVASSLSWTSQTGKSVLLNDEQMTINPLPTLEILLFVALIAGFVVLERQKLASHLIPIRQGRRKTRSRRRRTHRS